MTVRAFAIVYDSATKEVRRLIDTSADQTDSHLELIKKYLAPDETMEVFRQADFPVRVPRYVAPFIGQGVVIDKVDIATPTDTAKIKDISAASTAYITQQIVLEHAQPLPGLPVVIGAGG